MAENSKIQWTTNSWNPWHGCKKVSEGCKFCYMYRDKERYGQDPTTVLRSAPATFNKPLSWKEPALVFTCSWSDWFIDEADKWRADAWKIIKDTPHLTYQILTKRPERILNCLPEDWGSGYPNVWLGISVENQKAANLRIPQLWKIPARIKFVSMEPWIGDVNFYDVPTMADYSKGDLSVDLNFPFQWLIIGGESGNETGKYRYRPMKIEWLNETLEAIFCQKKSKRPAVFIKQLGTSIAREMKLKDWHGGDIDEFPEQLKIREFPM